MKLSTNKSLKLIYINLLLTIFTSSPVFAGISDFHERTLTQLTRALKDRLTFPGSSRTYQAAFEKWKINEANMRSEIEKDPSRFQNIVNKYLRLGLSHLGLVERPKGSFGLEIEQQGSVYRVVKIDPNGAAHEKGISVGDFLKGSKLENINEDVRENDSIDPFVYNPKNEKSVTLSRPETDSKESIESNLGIKVTRDTIGWHVNHIEKSSKLNGHLRAREYITQINGRSTVDIDPNDSLNTLSNSEEVNITWMPWNLSTLVAKNVSGKGFLGSEIESPEFKVEASSGKSPFVYLKIPSWTNGYDPEIVYQAFQEANKTKKLVVDLRGNRGGREEHFQGFLLRPGTTTGFEANRRRPGEEYPPLGLPAAMKAVLTNDSYILPYRDLDPKNIDSTTKARFLRRHSNNAAETEKSLLCKPLNFEEVSKVLDRMKLDTEKDSYLAPEKKELIYDLLVKKRKELTLLESELRSVCVDVSDDYSKAIQLVEEGQNEVTHFFRNPPQCDLTERTPITRLTLPQSDAIFDVFYNRLINWAKNTIQEYYSITENYYPEARVATLVPSSLEEYKRFGHLWKRVPEQMPTPYFGDICFILDENSFCGSQKAVSTPLEYGKLRDQGKWTKNSITKTYNGELHPRKIEVIGTSGAAAQGGVFQQIGSKYQLYYPAFDVMTPVEETYLETTPVRGTPFRIPRETDQHDSVIEQAMEWFDQTHPVNSDLVK